MNEVLVSDFIADQLVAFGVTHVFGIIGSANAYIFDSIYRNKKLELVCLHHEQACVMAAHGYYMQSGRMAVVLVTAGAGTTNALTGVIGAWADSVPILIISGQESTLQFKNNNICRMIGIQGVFTESIYSSCTKKVVTCMSAKQAINELDICLHLANEPRKGPCLIDLPMNIQSEKIGNINLNKTRKIIKGNSAVKMNSTNSVLFDQLIEKINVSSRPLLWLGNGLRDSDKTELENIIKDLSIPYLTSWTANDILSPIENLYAGHAGTYGSRAGNIILQSCDLLITLGTRLSVPQIGYRHDEIAREADIYVIEIDTLELRKLDSRFKKINSDAFLTLKEIHKLISPRLIAKKDWLKHIKEVKDYLPLIESCHVNNDRNFINSYQFISKLGSNAKEKTTFVTDMGTALISGFQILKMKDEQKLFTSQGLGEMGYGLPGAIGAWFADQTRNIICLNCDGGLMMNLQELHSVISNKIPMKIIIFNNDGYLMIKHTQNAILKGRRAGTDTNSGLSCPDYSKLVKSLGFIYLRISDPIDMDRIISEFLDNSDPIVLEVFMPKEQKLVPKSAVSISSNGGLTSLPLEDLSPLISLSELKKLLLVNLHNNSYQAKREKYDIN